MPAELVINALHRVRNICCGGIGPNSCRCNAAAGCNAAPTPDDDEFAGYDPNVTNDYAGDNMETPLTAAERDNVMPTTHTDADGLPSLGQHTTTGNIDHLFHTGMSTDDRDDENRKRLGTEPGKDKASDEELNRLLFGRSFAD